MAGWEFGGWGCGVWRQRWKRGDLDIWKRKPTLVGERLRALKSGCCEVLALHLVSMGQKPSCCSLGELSNPRSWGVEAWGTIPASPWVLPSWLLRVSQTHGPWNLLLHCGQCPAHAPCLLVPGWPLEHAAAPGTLPAEGGIWAETCLPACVPTSPPSFPSPTEHLWPRLPSAGCSLGGRLPTHTSPSPASHLPGGQTARPGGGRQTQTESRSPDSTLSTSHCPSQGQTSG